jgi:hypothetical protein
LHFKERTMITPTVGRIVWYRPIGPQADEQPWAAIIVRVHTDRVVNLTVFDHDGYGKPKQGVQLLQEGDAVPSAGGGYCEWMPYQKGQAAKTEALEAQVKTM